MLQNKHPRLGRAGFTLKFLLLSLCFWSLAAFAQLTIEVRGHGAKRIPVVIAEFSGNPEITAVVRSDLERSTGSRQPGRGAPGMQRVVGRLLGKEPAWGHAVFGGVLKQHAMPMTVE